MLVHGLRLTSHTLNEAVMLYTLAETGLTKYHHKLHANDKKGYRNTHRPHRCSTVHVLCVLCLQN